MDRPPRQRENHDKAEASGEKPLTKAEAAKAMDKLKGLTRGLLTVTRADLQQELSKHAKSRNSKHVKP